LGSEVEHIEFGGGVGEGSKESKSLIVTIYGTGVNLVAIGQGKAILAGTPGEPQDDGFYSLNGGDFMMQEENTVQVSKALDLAGHLITLVDHLFEALVRQHPDVIAEQREALVEIPPLVIRAREAVDAARRQLRAEEEVPGESS